MKPLVIANWKMNPRTYKEAEKLFNAVKKGIKQSESEVIFAIPYPYLYMGNSKFEARNPKLGAQDCFWELSGPYTGEVSPQMLKSLGVEYVIIGHSERRSYFGETDEMINKKLKAALAAELIPILCIGEKKGEDAKEIVTNQLDKNLSGIADTSKIILAYEPVWAISTSGGEICSPEYAKTMLEFIKQRFSGKIIYGGSVDSKISAGYIKAGFDGLLVGNASLDAEEFIRIVNSI